MERFDAPPPNDEVMMSRIIVPICFVADSTVGRSVAEERARRYSGMAFWGVMEVESEGPARRESISRPERGFTVSFLRPFAFGGTVRLC